MSNPCPPANVEPSGDGAAVPRHGPGWILLPTLPPLARSFRAGSFSPAVPAIFPLSLAGLPLRVAWNAGFPTNLEACLSTVSTKPDEVDFASGPLRPGNPPAMGRRGLAWGGPARPRTSQARRSIVSGRIVDERQPLDGAAVQHEVSVVTQHTGKNERPVGRQKIRRAAPLEAAEP